MDNKMQIVSCRKCAPAVVEALHSSEALYSVLGVSPWRRSLPAFYSPHHPHHHHHPPPPLSEVLFFPLKWPGSSPRFQQSSCIFIAIWRIPTGLNKAAHFVKKLLAQETGFPVDSTRLTGCDLVRVLHAFVPAYVHVHMYFSVCGN